VHLIFANFASIAQNREIEYPRKFRFRPTVALCVYYSVNLAKVTQNFVPCKVYTLRKRQISEMSTLHNHQIKMQLKYSVLQYSVKSMKTYAFFAL